MTPSLYIHIPVCVRKCAYCDFFSVPVRNFPAKTASENANLDTLVAALAKEIACRKKEFDIEGWKTVYIGGGTPSILSPDELYALGAPLAGMEGAEFTVEANPEDLTAAWLDACKAAGINRLSLGIQSMSDESLAAVQRRGTAESNRRALELVAKSWNGRLSLDLISGLPGQTPQRLSRDIEELVSFDPDHISLYSLTIEEGTPLEAMLADPARLARLPGEDEASELWIMGRDILEEKGFIQYEVSNFAKPGAESRHNTTYWNLETYLGAGPGATGTVITGDTSIRRVNTTDIGRWLDRPETSFDAEHISREDNIKEAIMMGMRMISGIGREKFRMRFGVDVVELIPETVAAWIKKGLLKAQGDSLALNRDGLLFLNKFLADCLAEL